MSTQHPVRYSHRTHLAAGQKPQHRMLSRIDEEGIVMEFVAPEKAVNHE